MIKRLGIIFQLILLISLWACHKKVVPQVTAPANLDPQTIIEDYVKKEMQVKTVFKIREILAFDSVGNLLREVQLGKENNYRINISFRYDEFGRISEEILLGEMLAKPLRKYQYIYKENFETIVNRFHLDEKTKQWKPQTAIGKIDVDKKSRNFKKIKRSGFRFQEKEGISDLENLKAMTAKNKISTKYVPLEQGILVLVLYMDYSL